MKNFIVILVCAVSVFLGISPICARADEVADYETEITEELESLLADYDLDLGWEDLQSLSAEELWGKIWRRISAELRAPMRMISAIFLVIVFTALTGSAGEAMPRSTSGIYGMVCALAAVTVIVPPLMTVYSRILRAIELTGDFILVFVPVFAASAAAGGGFTTAGVYHVMMLGASEVAVKLSESWLLPILGVMTALGITGSVFPDTSLEGVTDLIKKAVTWGISIVMTLFTGFVTLKCSISGRADGAATKTVKMLVSGFVPIVGGAVSDAYSTMKGSFEVIGATVGTAGILGIVMLLLPLIIEIFAYRGVMWAGTAAAELFAADTVSKLLKSVDSGLAIAQSVMTCYGVMFVLCSAILMKSFGG